MLLIDVGSTRPRLVSSYGDKYPPALDRCNFRINPECEHYPTVNPRQDRIPGRYPDRTTCSIPVNQGQGKIQLAVLANLNERDTWLDTHELAARVYTRDFTGHEFVTRSQLSIVGRALQSLAAQGRVVTRRGTNRAWWATPAVAARFEASDRQRERAKTEVTGKS